MTVSLPMSVYCSSEHLFSVKYLNFVKMQNAKKNIRESTESNEVKINNEIELNFQGKSPIIESFFLFLFLQVN